MANNVSIEPCEFHNVRTGEVTYGVRIYDDAGCTYDNCWDSIPDDDLEVLRKVIEGANEFTSGLLDYIRESERWIFIGGERYEFEQIKDILFEGW